MSRARNVVWTEGLFLTPHLFQQSDRHYETLLNFRLKSLAPYFWGLSELEIDRAGLPNNFFTLYRCTGIMPDGLPIQIPEEDLAPEVRSINKDLFPPSAESLDVYLTIPGRQAAGVNFAIEENGSRARGRRYDMETVRVADETADGNDCEIPIARKNFEIVFGRESLQGKIWLKIARLGRTASGTLTLDDSYVAPSIAVSASESLMAILHRILEVLAAKSAALSQQRRHISEFGSSDIANFWLLHTVNSFVPLLSHFNSSPNRHPEQLYLTLAQLVGELSTFALQTDPRDVPKYDHDDVHTTIYELEQKIRFLLETIIPAKYVIISLEKTPEFWYVGDIHDDRLLRNAQFYLAASAQVAPTRLIEGVPSQAKISSPDEIAALIGRAVPGVVLGHEPIPPSSIPVKPGYKYFHIHTQGRWWEAISKSRRLALYLPDEFPELKIEIVAVKE